jgi:LPXTG-motif cell wall-anchored protein
MMSASAMDKKMNKKMMMSASASPLPRTGGISLMPLLSAGALALIAGSGILAARLVRRNS